MRTCEFCHQPNLRHPNARYCSPEHKSRAYSARKLAAREEARQARTGQPCEQCGRPVPSNINGRARFCSPGCRTAWHNEQRSAERHAAKVTARQPCANPACGGPIPDDRPASALYCSADCKKQVTDARWRAKATGYNRMYLYGITPEQWQAQLDAQDGRCVVCRSDEWPGKDNRPHADHDHALPVFTLRGIACGNCNNGVGMFGDDPVRLVAAARYLLTAKASPAGAGTPCDDPALLGAGLRALAGGDPALLRAAAGYLEAALVS